MRAWIIAGSLASLAIGMSSGSLAHAEDRYQFLGGSSDSKVFLNIDKIEVGRDWTWVWFLTVSASSKFTMIKSQVNCQQNTMQRIYGALFSPDGATIHSEGFTESPSPIVPQTTGDSTFAYICKHEALDPKATFESQEAAREMAAGRFANTIAK